MRRLIFTRSRYRRMWSRWAQRAFCLALPPILSPGILHLRFDRSPQRESDPIAHICFGDP